METIINNQLKYQNYKEQFKRLNKAINNNFFLEAIFIEYVIMEDRTESILSYEGNGIKSDNFVSIDRKLRKIKKIAEQKKSLPKNLTLDESVHLLEAVDGQNRERDYCILTLFLNCGLRISELCGLNLTDIQGEAMRVLGKGNKVRIVYLNDACKDALSAYLAVRRPIVGRDQNALFLSSRNERISKSTVHALVKKHISAAGLDATQYSSHKLRHTAATLMLQNGVDVRAVQEVLGHDHLNTTEIYTHIDNEALRVAAKANPLSHVKNTHKEET